MNSYDTDEDFDELERCIIDNETTDDDDIAEDLEDAVEVAMLRQIVLTKTNSSYQEMVANGIPNLLLWIVSFSL